jgi:hypothetical protein
LKWKRSRRRPWTRRIRPLSSATLRNDIRKQQRRILIHKEPITNLRRPIPNHINLPVPARARRIRITIRQTLTPRLQLHVRLNAASALVCGTCFNATSRGLRAGRDVEVEERAGEDLVRCFGLVGGNGVPGLVSTDVAQVTVLAD